MAGPTLRVGCPPSEYVADAQAKLLHLGYFSGPVSGEFGADTEIAVMSFQSDLGLGTDGVVGPVTWAALDDAVTGAVTMSPPEVTPVDDHDSSGRPTLRRGSPYADWVVDAQGKLAALGYYTRSIDGDFGSGTEAAVKSFQRDWGLSADGVVGPLTWAALDGAAGGLVTVPEVTVEGDPYAPVEIPEVTIEGDPNAPPDFTIPEVVVEGELTPRSTRWSVKTVHAVEVGVGIEFGTWQVGDVKVDVDLHLRDDENEIVYPASFSGTGPGIAGMTVSVDLGDFESFTTSDPVVASAFNGTANLYGVSFGVEIVGWEVAYLELPGPPTTPAAIAVGGLKGEVGTPIPATGFSATGPFQVGAPFGGGAVA